MNLADDECWARLAGERHGTLATIHSQRGVDAVPVVFVVYGREIVIPIDRVKPKASTRLQRVANLERDDRCVLLVDHYAEDWLQLWWVRVHGHAAHGHVDEELAARLVQFFPAYRTPGAIESVLRLRPTEVRGWSARTTAPPGAAG